MPNLDSQEFIAWAFLPVAMVSVAAIAATLLGMVVIAVVVNTFRR